MNILNIGKTRGERGAWLRISLTTRKNVPASLIVTWRGFCADYFLRIEWRPQFAITTRRWRYTGGT